VGPVGPVDPVGPVGPVLGISSSTIIRVAFNGVAVAKNTVAVLAFTRESITGATTTLIMPSPVTSSVLIGELPSWKSPCFVESNYACQAVIADVAGGKNYCVEYNIRAGGYRSACYPLYLKSYITHASASSFSVKYIRKDI
jgi:hypothetical protein